MLKFPLFDRCITSAPKKKSNCEFQFHLKVDYEQIWSPCLDSIHSPQSTVSLQHLKTYYNKCRVGEALKCCLIDRLLEITVSVFKLQ